MTRTLADAIVAINRLAPADRLQIERHLRNFCTHCGRRGKREGQWLRCLWDEELWTPPKYDGTRALRDHRRFDSGRLS